MLLIPVAAVLLLAEQLPLAAPPDGSMSAPP